VNPERYDTFSRSENEPRREPFEPAWSEVTDEVQEESAQQPEDPEVTDKNDPRYVEVRTPEYVQHVDRTCFVRNARGELVQQVLRLATGKTLITYRLRKTGEEGLEFVVGGPDLPPTVPEVTFESTPGFNILANRAGQDDVRLDADPRIRTRRSGGGSWLKIANRPDDGDLYKPESNDKPPTDSRNW